MFILNPLETELVFALGIDSVLHEIMNPPKKLHASLVSRIKVMANMDTLLSGGYLKMGRITLRVHSKTIDVRVASLPTAYGEKVNFKAVKPK